MRVVLKAFTTIRSRIRALPTIKQSCCVVNRSLYTRRGLLGARRLCRVDGSPIASGTSRAVLTAAVHDRVSLRRGSFEMSGVAALCIITTEHHYQ